MPFSNLSPRHIQDLHSASQLEPHWGYADRAVPCTNDPGSCEYLDVVYSAHDVGLIYTGVFWLTIVAILVIWFVGRKVCCPPPGATASSSPGSEGGQQRKRTSTLRRLGRTVAATCRRHLLPESLTSVFGHTTRLQVLVLGLLAAYLLVWSMVGIRYGTWVTPVSGTEAHNTRTSLGPWADRVGVLAYALTPLSVLLSSRESLLSAATGLPHQSFLFLHRWLGHVVLAQAALHTAAWCVVEAALYQPQPAVGREWVAQAYIIWGVAAMALLALLWVLSTAWAVRALGYEFFRKAHYVLALAYMGAAVGHWRQLQCFLVPGLVLWGLDRAARLARAAVLHCRPGKGGWWPLFAGARARITRFADGDGDVVRLDYEHAHRPWDVGQHFYLCFAEASIWQSHPFTPLAPPVGAREGMSVHSYVFRAKAGETRKVAQLAEEKCAGKGGRDRVAQDAATTSVVMTGPYGRSITRHLAEDANVLCVAGGTGITFVLPVLLQLVRGGAATNRRRIELAWAVRHRRDLEWVRPELDELRTPGAGVKVEVYVTRETGQSTTVLGGGGGGGGEKSEDVIEGAGRPLSSSSAAGENVGGETGVSIHKPRTVESPQARRPHLDAVVEQFLGSVARGPTTVFASGPLNMVADLRTVVARSNSGREVWRGEERSDVRLVCDDRSEW